MRGVKLVLVVTRRVLADDYRAFFRREGLCAVFSALCEGTASHSMLSVLGLEDTRQALLGALADREQADRALRRMVADMGICMPGGGIAAILPVGSFGGASSARYLMEMKDPIAGEEKDMGEHPVYPYDLIVAIAERGSADEIMDAARAAGAGGGTIVHGKGTATEYAAKYFGVSIAAEKELVLIVTGHAGKDAIMRAIMEKAGLRTPTRAALFSLPVESVAGIAQP